MDSLDNVKDVNKEEKSNKEMKNNLSEKTVKFSHIYKTFNPGTVNEQDLFTDFNLSLKEDSFNSVVGSNGSGKTTMLNLLCGSIPIDSGDILIDGKNITKMKEHRRSRFIGRVYQDPAMGTCPGLTILENMSLSDNKERKYTLAPGTDKKKVDYFRDELSLLGMGLEDKLQVKVGTLSGGQRQALSLLIATMSPIKLLILDEHTAALDPKSSELVMDLTQRVISEKHITTIMVTHNLKFAVSYGNRLLMMHRGDVVFEASGEAKNNVSIKDLTDRFDEISIEDGNTL